MKGWIYIISNDSVPNWLAIGSSDTDPDALVRQYGNSGIKLPYPFELQYALRTPYPNTVLQKIHEQLASQCVNPQQNSDWFECDLLHGIRTTRQIAGNSATGEAFYNRARQMVEQAQAKTQPPPQPATPTTTLYSVANNPPTRLVDSEPPEVQQVRIAPEPQHGRRPSPIAPKVATPTPPVQPKPAPKKFKIDNPTMVKALIVVWVMLMMVLVFLVAYLYRWV